MNTTKRTLATLSRRITEANETLFADKEYEQYGFVTMALALTAQHYIGTLKSYVDSGDLVMAEMFLRENIQRIEATTSNDILAKDDFDENSLEDGKALLYFLLKGFLRCFNA